MTFRCIHMSDIHFRGLKRHDEYKKVFERFYKKASLLNPDVIFLGGDIVHSKVQGISPELIEILSVWFNNLAKIAPVHVILGNHDGLILNLDRQDTITPIIKALNNKNIHLYKNSGIYPTGVKGYNWAVFSCFDEANWNKVKPVKNEINIALYHGGVLGSTTDTNWEINGEVELDFFKEYDFAFLGDIHKFQYLDVEKRIAYPGSPIQQNFGEDIKKGFLFWEINNKNDYTSKFIELKNDNPFLTIDWQGSVEETIEKYSDIPSSARIRITSNEEISQFDIKEIHAYLKSNKRPLEITYKIDVESKTFTYNDVVKNNLDIKNEDDRKALLKTLYDDLTEQEIEDVSCLYNNMLNTLVEKRESHSKWEINSLKFNNTFSYGKDNYINFDNMSGIVGLFGKNRTGKSSIPGTIMYALFNSSDRGAIKNLHIINNRKGHCDAEVTFTIDDNSYVVSRNTNKKESKKGSVSATTKLEVYRIDKNGIRINESEEQRRESDKLIKSLLGNAEDFLYTGFASQGSLNSFIEEKSTARKNILTKFLDLNIFEELYTASRDEYAILKDKIKKASDKNWNSLDLEAKDSIKKIETDLLKINKDIDANRERIIDLKTQETFLKSSSKKHKSGMDYDECADNITYLKDKLSRLKSEVNELNEQLAKNNLILQKISDIKVNFPIEDLKTEKSRLDNLVTNLNKLTYKLDSKKKEVKRLENSLEVLNDIPCENKFTSCKFIKEANENMEILPKSKKEISELSDEINNILYAADVIKEKDIDTKIKKYEESLRKEYKLSIDNKSINEKIENKKSLIVSCEKELKEKELVLEELRNFTKKDDIQKINELIEQIKKVSLETKSLEEEKQFCIQKIANLNSYIEIWEKEKKEFKEVSNQWKIFDIFLKSIGKKGIPAFLINNALPMINNEISKILTNAVNFKVTIEPDSLNNLDIYIDYGDSKRIIECCSGMEKMMSSIAIRVALINISNLAKPNMFILDEGFGALDSNNIDSCASLLESLKKYFKTILIISHVDAIKDIVDNTIEITSKGKDSYVRYV